jgi:hypothetical protein
MTATPPEDYPQLGRYQIINKIASGGMAEVFLARAVGAMGFQRLVAVKLIHANFTRDPDFVKMFIDEARIAMHLHHRNIVQVFDLDQVQDTYFIAMEFVHGVNVYDLYEAIAAKNRWVEVPLALYIVAEVCKGLHFAHTRVGPDGRPMNIVHRDISPQNVLLSFEGEVKITDFGIATAAERLHQTAAGIVKGKYAYMAPERLEDRPVDGRVDVFAAGVLLYELLVGENPFAGASAVETIEAVIGREVEPPSAKGVGVSPKLDEIVLRALAKEPADRYPSAQAFADDLTEFAMDMTFARKEMASGDAAIATTLAELFPARAKNPPGATATPAELELPGVLAQAPDPDIDAPTVLRMSPVVADDLDSTASSDRTRLQEAVSAEDAHDGFSTDEGLSTLNESEPTRPTALEDGPPAADEDDGYAPTMLSMEAADPSRPTFIDGGADRRGESPPPVRPDPHEHVTPRGPNPPGSHPGRAPSAPPSPRGSTRSSPSSSSSGPRSAVGPGASSAPPASSGPAGDTGGPRRNLLVIGLGVVAALVALLAGYVVTQGSRTPARLTIRSEPSGADVRINGRLQAGKTPIEAEVRRAEPLSIEVFKAGFEPFREDVRLAPGEARELVARLSAETGSIIIRPNPESAEVWVDGESRGTGKVSVQGLEFGRPVRITVRARGYAAQEHDVTLSSQEPKLVLPISLQRRRR